MCISRKHFWTTLYELYNVWYISRFSHTSQNEGFNSLRLTYCSKRIGYKFEAAEIRGYLAAIDHNHHIGREVLVNENGFVRMKRKWQARSCRWSVVPCKVEKDYKFAACLLTQTMLYARGAVDVSANDSMPSFDPCTIAPTMSGCPPETKVLEKLHCSRFVWTCVAEWPESLFFMCLI